MPTINGEKYATRQLSGDRAERIYIVRDSTNDAEVRDLLLATAPTGILTDNNNIFLPIDRDACEVLEVEDGIWNATAVYRRKGRAELETVGDETITYDVTTTSSTIYQSRDTKDVVTTAGAAVVNNNQMINVTPEGVEGVDIEIPIMTATMERVYSDAQISQAFLGQLYQITGTVNDSFFKGLQAGEGLLSNITGGDNGDGTWSFSFTWSISPNETNLDVGNGIIIPNKNGWDYLWVRYAISANADQPTPEPRQAQVEKVYRYTDWSIIN